MRDSKSSRKAWGQLSSSSVSSYAKDREKLLSLESGGVTGAVAAGVAGSAAGGEEDGFDLAGFVAAGSEMAFVLVSCVYEWPRHQTGLFEARSFVGVGSQRYLTMRRP